MNKKVKSGSIKNEWSNMQNCRDPQPQANRGWGQMMQRTTQKR